MIMDANADWAPMANEPLEALAERIHARHATVAVVGLGYVGLPLMMAIRDAGFPVIGVDAQSERIESLASGRSYIVDVTDSDVDGLAPETLSTDPTALLAADVILICVPTPLADHSPDLSMVRDAAADVSDNLLAGRLVVLESTTYPGTTEEEVLPILEKSGLTLGEDFALAYSPERIDPGQRDHRVDNTPKIVGGVTERCRELATSFYGEFVREVVGTSSPREAEMAKLVENTFRQVNIALVNELAILARELGVDIWEALEAASTKPFGYMAFWPGPGVGGHCISIDPSYLSWRSGQRLGYRIGFIEHANEVNNRMPEYVVSRLGEALNDAGKPIRGARIFVIGAAYKAGVDDPRESPAIAVMERLAAKGAELSYNDPRLATVHVGGRTLRSQPVADDAVARADCVLILTSNDDLDVRQLASLGTMVFDTRGVTRSLNHANIVRL
jgi:UDP-N-acetyl-D-glucosamine dehydrogenase